MLQLRDYQQVFVGAVQQRWADGYKDVLGVSPTGSGKTVCFSAITHDHRGASATVVHRREILQQISIALGRLDTPHRVIAPPKTLQAIRRRHLKEFGRSFIDPSAQKGVVSVQTLTSKAAKNNADLRRWLGQVTLCIFDEGHHYVTSGIWSKAVNMFKDARRLFVTATPERADGKGLGADADGFAEVMVEGPNMRWLMDNGYLSRYVNYCPETDYDISDIPLTATGDLNTRVMRQRVVESHLVGDVVRHYLKLAKGRKAIVFATDVQSAVEIAEEFQRQEVKAVQLNGGTDAAERDRELDRFENGDLDVLVNVDLFDEGFDVPAVECVVMARPTESLAKYMQMVGRALRPVYADGYDLSTTDGRLAAMASGPKPRAIVIDPVQNWKRHGLPEWPRKWSLDGREKGSRGQSDTVKQIVCLVCTQTYPAFMPRCWCGEPKPLPETGGRKSPEVVDGDLMALDADALEELLFKRQQANKSDEEYAAEQIARRIPPVGRGADMRRFQALKHRRKVLYQLMAWWFGVQPADRDMDEKYRRFYHRFGVDVVTAFTLKLPETEALIDDLKTKFEEDLVQ